MINIFDTHRLLYKNAQLRAFKKDTPTVQQSFKNYDGADIGNIVYTNENGYLCYGSNMQTVTELLVAEAAIVQVSLDGGSSWPIEWIVSSETAQTITEDDVGTLTFYDENGQQQVWDPLAGDAELPDYVRRNEFDPDTRWQETMLRYEDDATCLVATKWTSVVYIPNTVVASTLYLNISDCRPGQKIIVLAYKSVTFRLEGPFSSTGTIPAGKVGVVGIAALADNSLRGMVVPVDGITVAAAEVLIKNLITTESGPYRTEINGGVFGITENNQTFTCTDTPNTGIYYVHMEDTGTHQDQTIVIPAPDRNGEFTLIVDANYPNSVVNNNIYVQLGTNARVTILNQTMAGQYVIRCKIVAWQNQMSVRKYAVVVEGVL